MPAKQQELYSQYHRTNQLTAGNDSRVEHRVQVGTRSINSRCITSRARTNNQTFNVFGILSVSHFVTVVNDQQKYGNVHGKTTEEHPS